MSMSQLHPITTTDQYLDAILAELRRISDLLIQAQPAPEPAQSFPSPHSVQVAPLPVPQPARRGPGRPRKVPS